MLPVWANINFDFKKKKIEEELLNNNIFDKGVVATTDYNDEGRSRWIQMEIFSQKKFLKRINLYIIINKKMVKEN